MNLVIYSNRLLSESFFVYNGSIQIYHIHYSDLLLNDEEHLILTAE